MKKILIMSTLLLLTCIAISCGQKEKAPKKIVLSFVSQDIPGNPTYAGHLAAQEKLLEISGGMMSIEFVQMTKHGSLSEMIDICIDDDGIFDITFMGYTILDYAIDDLFILSQVARDYEQFLRILESPFGKGLEAQFAEVGVVASPPWYYGMRRTTSNTPINKVADFKNLKMRTLPTEASEAFPKCMGAEIVHVDFQFLAEALSSREVDAQENPVSVIEAAKLYEHQKYLAMTEHEISCSTYLINKTRYDAFTEEQRKWYDEAIEYGRQVSTELVLKNETELLEKFVNEYGMIITTPDLDEIHQAMKPYYDELEERYGSIFSELLAL